MPITDNLIVRVAPVSGETSIKNRVDDSLFTSASGSVSLVTEGSEQAWLFDGVASGATSQTKSISYTTNAGVAGGGVTVAIRLKEVTHGGSNYDAIASVSTGGGIKNGAYFGKSGADYRARGNNTTTSAVCSSESFTTTRTVVYRVTMSATSAQDYTKVWIDRASRGDNNPDFTTSGENYTNLALTLAYLECPADTRFRLLDFCVWSRELTDAECAAVADDIRGQLPVGSSTTVNATLATSHTQRYAAAVNAQKQINASLATTHTATYTAVVAVGNSINAALATSQTSAFPAVVNAAKNISATLAASHSATFAATITTNPSITTEALKNNTGTLLASQSGIEACVYSLTDGSLVVRKTGLTSDASGIVSFSDAALSAGTTYRVTISISTADGIARIQAA